MTGSNNLPRCHHNRLQGGVTPARRKTLSRFETSPHVREGSRRRSWAALVADSECRYRTLKGAMT